MSKPHSFKVQPWTAFPRDTYSILTDDFVHQKLLTVKVASSSLRGNVNLKNQIVAKGDNFNSSGQIKAWFSAWKQSTIYFKSVNKELKLHYDNGVTKINDQKFNFYGSVQTQKSNQSSTFKVGAIYFNPKFDLDNRVRVSMENPKQPHISTGHKISLVKNKWSFTAFEIWNWNGVAAIARNAIRIGYLHNPDTSVFLRATHNQERRLATFNWGNIDEYFGYFAFNLTHKVNKDVTIATEVDFTLRKVGTVSALVLKALPERKGWVKIRGQKTSTATNIALAYQGLIKDYGKWILGVEVAGLGDKNTLKYGVQVDLNL